MAEVLQDATTTEEILVAEDVMAVLEAKENHLVVLDQEKKVVLEAIEILQDENLVHFKEMKDQQDVLLKEVLIDQQVVHLTQQKAEDQEEVKEIATLSLSK